VKAFESVEGGQAVTSGFEDFYRAHRERAVELAWLLTHDGWIAEDIAQDAFISLFHVFGEVDNRAAYLRRCVVNGVYERTRRRQRERRRNALVIAGQPQSTDGPTGGVIDLVATLPIDQRTAVVLRYWAGLRDGEIADAMGIKPSSARSHLSRASTRLRKELL